MREKFTLEKYKQIIARSLQGDIAENVIVTPEDVRNTVVNKLSQSVPMPINNYVDKMSTLPGLPEMPSI